MGSPPPRDRFHEVIGPGFVVHPNGPEDPPVRVVLRVGCRSRRTATIGRVGLALQRRLTRSELYKCSVRCSMLFRMGEHKERPTWAQPVHFVTTTACGHARRGHRLTRDPHAVTCRFCQVAIRQKAERERSEGRRVKG